MNTEPPLFVSKVSSPLVSSLFNLTDPTEHFMAGWISRVHMNRPRLFKALDLKRAEQQAADKTRRLIYELAYWQGHPHCYMVITWNIDDISMRWQDFAKRREAMAIYRALSGG